MLLAAHTDRIVGEACLEDHVLKLTPSDPAQGGEKSPECHLQYNTAQNTL